MHYLEEELVSPNNYLYSCVEKVIFCGYVHACVHVSICVCPCLHDAD